MKRFFLLSVTAMVLLFGCDSKPEQQKEKPEKVYVDILQDTIRGFDTIEGLTRSFIRMLEENDYSDYLSHTMQKPMEEDQAAKIKDSDRRRRFMEEYGFTLKEEQHYFDQTVNFLRTHDIHANMIQVEEMVVIPYKKELYDPLELYEVYIPLDAEHRDHIYYVAIKVGEDFYMTSELTAL